MANTTIDQIAVKLLQQKWTVAVAESVTAGRVQALLTSCSGASQFFGGGLTAYSIDQKVRLLNVDRKHSELVNCVSEQVCEEMAHGAADLFHADVAVATTGYAEPNEVWHISHPMAYVGVWLQPMIDREQRAFQQRQISATGSREDVQAYFAQQSLEHLLDVLKSV